MKVITACWLAYLILDVDHYMGVSGVRPLDWAHAKKDTTVGIYEIFKSLQQQWATQFYLNRQGSV